MHQYVNDFFTLVYHITEAYVHIHTDLLMYRCIDQYIDALIYLSIHIHINQYINAYMHNISMYCYIYALIH